MYLLKKKFFFKELGLKQNGCIEVKSATGLYFSTSGGRYLSIKIKKGEKALIFATFRIRFSNAFDKQLF